MSCKICFWNNQCGFQRSGKIPLKESIGKKICRFYITKKLIMKGMKK